MYPDVWMILGKHYDPSKISEMLKMDDIWLVLTPNVIKHITGVWIYPIYIFLV